MDEGRKTMVKSSENKITTVQDNIKMDLEIRVHRFGTGFRYVNTNSMLL
jgi:hypothetical protein